VQIYNRAIPECQQLFALNGDSESVDSLLPFLTFAVGS
jgi:hypothetical protein